MWQRHSSRAIFLLPREAGALAIHTQRPPVRAAQMLSAHLLAGSEQVVFAASNSS